ncbi:MAG: zinc ribbon domain-containing protein [Methanobrevibacter sp.]|uniref:zinc ribbon domain-containing protein n=1 Tax=Methanobrevibacter sp. TaxID=66852 RepID=UPI0025D43F81|nr:zinc ribbon domain-containing protein [Methanobrevibacter sp.]MBE6507884.1 zinc ribbon domain-containing protein [Methanobrevibacter sp.]
MTKFCPFCGEALVDEAKFCKSCGKSLENINFNNNTQQTGYSQPYSVPVVEKSHTAAIVLGYVFAFLIPLIGLIIGIYLATRNDSQKAKRHGIFVLIVAIAVWVLNFIIIAS